MCSPASGEPPLEDPRGDLLEDRLGDPLGDPRADPLGDPREGVACGVDERCGEEGRLLDRCLTRTCSDTSIYKKTPPPPRTVLGPQA